MKNFWKTSLYLFLQLGVELFINSQDIWLPSQFSIIFSLDIKNQTTWPFKVSTIDEELEDWFFYYDNLTPKGLTPLAAKYFENVNLSQMDSVGGVWVAFFTERHSEPAPIFEFSTPNHRSEILELTYYIHGTGKIVVEHGQNQTSTLILGSSLPYPIWETFSLDLSGPTFKVELMPNSPGDFVLIDKIYVGYDATTITASIPTSTMTMTNPTYPSTYNPPIPTTSGSPSLKTTHTTTTTTTTTTPQPPVNYVLDLKNQTNFPFNISKIEEKYEDWFFYYDNLTTAGLTPLATKYLEDVNLSQMDSVGGVWVAYFTEKGSPVYNDPFPFVTFTVNQGLKSLALRYYIHGTANITIEEGQNHHTLFSGEPTVAPTWATFNWDLSGSMFTIWLMPTSSGDFVLIDKIVIEGLETGTSTGMTYPTYPSTYSSTMSSSTTTIKTTQTTSTKTTTICAATGVNDEFSRLEQPCVSTGTTSVVPATSSTTDDSPLTTEMVDATWPDIELTTSPKATTTIKMSTSTIGSGTDSAACRMKLPTTFVSFVGLFSWVVHYM